MQTPAVVSEMDKLHYQLIRDNVRGLLQRVGGEFGSDPSLQVLDIAPQDHAGAQPHFTAKVDTLDINPQSGCTYIGDICRENSCIAGDSYDLVICTEVLEHTLDPFAAVAEIYRILRPGGILVMSTPFNFRIHGPLPDCWRFTVHGLRALLGKFVDVQIEELSTPGRDLMPVHYTTVARKPR